MEKKSKVLVYLPRKLYVELHERQLTNHVSYLVSRLLEEFLRAADVRISWTEMENKAEQREYLERKLKEFLSRNGQPPVQGRKETFYVQERPKKTEEPPTPPVQEKSSPTYMQEKPKDVFVSANREEKMPPPEEDSGDDIDILKSLDNLW
jgi:hypothetical protein